MPVYDYKCQEHGLFYGLATVGEHSEPKPCPDCGVPSARVIILAPAILGLDRAGVVARDRNEQSRHQPRFSTPDSRAEDRERHLHRQGKTSGGRAHASHQVSGQGCGCGERPLGKAQLFYSADGKKMFPAMRPWMISH